MHYRQQVYRKGFALPTVLIASVVLLSVLAVAVSATSAIRTTLKNQYYAQLAQVAGEAGVAYAKACLAANGNVPQWTNAKPLRPNTDCSGSLLAGTTIKVLVVAGGGSGGSSTSGWGGGGGGGAGGYIYNDSFSVTPTTNYSITVGAGGAAVAAANARGINGVNSTFDSLTAIGGGAGGSGGSTGLHDGLVGGSGGGAGYNSYLFMAGTNGTAGQGNKSGDVLSNNNGGGGGGAGGVGGNTNSTGGAAGGLGGLGGAGVANSITGASLTYAKGGEGGSPPSGAAAGAANTGNGGSGVYGAAGSAAGGSGVVIVSYPTNSGISASGGTVTTAGIYKVHKFISGSSSFNVGTITSTGCPTDARCYVSVNGNVRSSFSVAAPTLDAQGKAVTIPYNGITEITRKSNGAVWRTYTQPSVQAAVVPDLCSGAATSDQGWNNAVRASTQDALAGAPSAQSITMANTTLNAGTMYFRRDVGVTSAGTYNIKVLSPSTQDIAEIYVGSQKVATSTGSLASGSVSLTAGCQVIMVKLTNSTADPRVSRFIASMQKSDEAAPIAVSDPDWRVTAGSAVHYSSPSYYASPTSWVPVRDYVSAVATAGNAAVRAITTNAAATTGYAYFRDNRTINVTSATPINGEIVCTAPGCVLYLDGDVLANVTPNAAYSFNATLQPGDHKFGVRLQGTGGTPYFHLTALRDSGGVISQTDANWSTTNAWTATGLDYYSYDNTYLPTPNSFTSGLVSILAVGGGGGGGTDMGGGGGGGGVVYNPAYTVTSSLDITVGDGGPGAAAAPNKGRGTNGGDSKAGNITSFGGGGGGSNYAANTSPPGSGSSAGGNAAYLQSTPAIGILGQGFGETILATPYYPSGGGGAGGVGGVAPGNGGVGVMNDILGPAYYWGGGGGGSGYNTGATGIGGIGGNGGGGGGAIGTTTGGAGLNAGSPGGGGAQAAQSNRPGGDGGANTGGGGGGGSHYNATNKGGDGGSGIVVISYPTGSILATGGTITSVGCPSACRTVHTFTGSGTFTIIPKTAIVKTLIVAGGGAGNGSAGTSLGGGGGGAGGVVYTSLGISQQSYGVNVGTGGVGVVGSVPGTSAKGQNSSFAGVQAVGGGFGGGYVIPPAAGGSGGGAGENGFLFDGALGVTGQGNGGGNDGTYDATLSAAGGGGGAGAAGGNSTGNTVGGVGGAGVAYSISGSMLTYGGGGGGPGTTTAGTGGSGGGGAGRGVTTGPGIAGTANTGGGGGGALTNASEASQPGGNGGSGIVIISYPTGSLVATGGTITTSGANTIHTFTSNGVFTVLSIAQAAPFNTNVAPHLSSWDAWGGSAYNASTAEVTIPTGGGLNSSAIKVDNTTSLTVGAEFFASTTAVNWTPLGGYYVQANYFAVDGVTPVNNSAGSPANGCAHGLALNSWVSEPTYCNFATGPNVKYITFQFISGNYMSPNLKLRNPSIIFH